MKIFSSIALTGLLLTPISYAEDMHDHEKLAKPSGVEALSPDLRKLLSKEMIALQGGMMSIIPAYISGNWSEIEKTAAKIKNSFILKQSLTESQAEELQSVLPSEFIEKDQRFHYLAGMLEHAAQSQKPELINFYFSEMNEACASCHTAFATHKFPALKPAEQDSHHH